MDMLLITYMGHTAKFPGKSQTLVAASRKQATGVGRYSKARVARAFGFVSDRRQVI
jgi:hypothetical protein